MCSSGKKNKNKSIFGKRLSPELLSTRNGMGNSKLTYVEGWVVIEIANKVFGNEGWSFEIKSLEIDFCEKENNRYSIGCTCIGRIAIKDGCIKEDVGFGSCENVKSKAIGLEKAKKEAATDSLKRALRHFGNVFGNCLYDKKYIKYTQSLMLGKEPSNFQDVKKKLFRYQDLCSTDEEVDENNFNDISDSIGCNFNTLDG